MTTPPTRKESTRSIETGVVIAAPVEAVWRALTDADELTRWYPLEARVTPGAGGSIFQSWKNGEWEWTVPIDTWEPNRRLGLLYYEGPDPHSKAVPPPTVRVGVEFHLDAEGPETTRVRLVHSGFSPAQDWDEMFDATRSGWEFQLRNLVHYLERHRGTPRRAIMVRRKAAMPREEAWGRLMSERGLLGAGSVLPASSAGGSFSLKTAAKVELAGTCVQHEPPRNLVGTVATLNDAFMRVQVDAMKPGAPCDVILFLSTYGLAGDRADAMERDLTALFDALFPAP